MSAYQHYTVRELWQMVAHESAASHAEAMRGWDAKRSMLSAQIGNLRRLRQDLADAWSPEGSPAAQAYLAEIDRTIDAMAHAQEAAGQARTIYAKVTDALIAAQQRIKPLHDAYDDRKAAWRAYLAKTPAGPMVSSLPESWAPDVGMPELATYAVLRQHREELDKQARAIMEDTDAKVTAATAQRVDMPRIQRFDDGATPPRPSVPHGGRSSGSSGTSRQPAPVFDPPPPSLGLINTVPGPLSQPITFDPGPFLTRTPPPVVPPVLMPPPPTVPTAAPTTSVTPQLPMPPMTSRRPGQLMPTNGVIERPLAQPGAGLPGRAPLGERRGAGSAEGSGVIRSTGRDNGRRAMSGRGAEGGERLPGGGWRDRSYEAYSQRRPGRQRSDDEVWHVREGVAPVLEPPPAVPTGDVPPGVIGIDR
ncbi:flagellar export protein FliJ [Dactylosporangium sp. CA-139114]|uniref:flagellar export protein FliJ n=1 Tax=Dactylosporangium sp. CA-139114 TaxID=3239931 RepID=UPI003D977269